MVSGRRARGGGRGRGVRSRGLFGRRFEIQRERAGSRVVGSRSISLLVEHGVLSGSSSLGSAALLVLVV